MFFVSSASSSSGRLSSARYLSFDLPVPPSYQLENVLVSSVSEQEGADKSDISCSTESDHSAVGSDRFDSVPECSAARSSAADVDKRSLSSADSFAH